MPAAAELVTSASTKAFDVPTSAAGFILWNTTATPLRVRFGAPAAASGANEGIPIAAGDTTTQMLTHHFSRPLVSPLGVFIYHAAGANITSGVGYEILSR